MLNVTPGTLFPPPLPPIAAALLLDRLYLMGISASLLLPSPSSSPQDHHRLSFGSSAALLGLSTSGGHSSSSNSSNNLLANEINELRSQLKAHQTIPFPHPIVFILFAPPEYPTVHAAEYLSKHVNLPVIYPEEYIVDKYGQYSSLQHGGGGQQQGNQRYHQSHHQQDHYQPLPLPIPQQQPLRQSLDLLNVSTRKLLKKASSIQENPTRVNLFSRIQQEDCQNGFILYEYPDTITEMKYFKNFMIPNCKIEIIHLKLDNEVRYNCSTLHNTNPTQPIQHYLYPSLLPYTTPPSSRHQSPAPSPLPPPPAPLETSSPLYPDITLNPPPPHLTSLATSFPPHLLPFTSSLTFLTSSLSLSSSQQTMRNLVHKFDRWIHEPSGRSYHLCTNPPKSFLDSNYNPCPENMIDDDTGEPLKQVCLSHITHTPPTHHPHLISPLLLSLLY